MGNRNHGSVHEFPLRGGSRRCGVGERGYEGDGWVGNGGDCERGGVEE